MCAEVADYLTATEQDRMEEFFQYPTDLYFGPFEYQNPEDDYCGEEIENEYF